METFSQINILMDVYKMPNPYLRDKVINFGSFFT